MENKEFMIDTYRDGNVLTSITVHLRNKAVIGPLTTYILLF